jgi:hypothetical protein
MVYIKQEGDSATLGTGSTYHLFDGNYEINLKKGVYFYNLSNQIKIIELVLGHSVPALKFSL